MAGTFPDPSASFANIFPALINKVEIKKTGETVSQYMSLGELEAGAELTAEPVNQKLSGNRMAQIGYKLSFKGVLVTSGVNMRTAISTVIGNETDTRLSDISSHKWSFLHTEMTISIGEEAKGDGEGSVKYPITGSGWITAARFNAVFSLT